MGWFWPGLGRWHVVAACAAAALILGLAAHWLRRPAIPVIGVMLPHSDTVDPDYKLAFIRSLEALGYRAPKSIEIRWSTGAGGPEDFRRRAEELARGGVGIMVVASTQARLAACSATRAAKPPVPVVIMTIADPAQCEAPNEPPRVTGSTLDANTLAGKQLELLRMLGDFRVVGILVNPDTGRVGARYLAELESYRTGVVFRTYAVRSARDLAPQFKAMAEEPPQQRPQALMVSPDALFREYAGDIAKLARDQGLPSMFSTRNQAEAGGLLAYGQSYPEAYERAATYVDRLLRGRPVADLPVEGPSKIILAVNQRTADALGLKIPLEILVRADTVFR